MATYAEIKAATNNFTNSVGLRVGKSRRYTRFLQPGIWDATGSLMLRRRHDGKHIAKADYGDEKAIENLVGDAELCEY